MNREQKRMQWKAARGNPDALWCDKCGHKTLHSALKVAGDVDHFDIYCPVCKKYKTRLRLNALDYDTQGRLFAHRLNDTQKAIIERKPGDLFGKRV